MLKILRFPDPALSQVCEPCETADKSLKKLAKSMLQQMYRNNGVGLAAPQVGVTKRLVVIDVDWGGEDGEKNPIVLVNPEIIEVSGDFKVEGEGCLSCPGINVPVRRQEFARVRYSDLDGDEWEIEGDGLLGRCLQHEIDHLDGKTLFDTCEPAVKIRALQAYDQALKAGAKPGDTSVIVS